MVDVAKHLTTLSSGSILLLTTLVRDAFGGEDVLCKGFRGPILLAFLVVLLCAMAVAWLVPLRIMYKPREGQEGALSLTPLQERDLKASKARAWFNRISAIAFFVGVLLLSVFGAVNYDILGLGTLCNSSGGD